MTYYLAYGSNMNLLWMAECCQAAQFVAKTTLEGYELAFRGRDTAYATIFKKEGSFVPVVIWQVDQADELRLDEYEDYPDLYDKEYLPIEVDGQMIEVMVYIMRDFPKGQPQKEYYEMIEVAYKVQGFDTDILKEALSN
ncbi:Uncharacterized conserved protein YtfP, gamma-glutamylcyclotransferase (GGCT)/AIG2-like family [Granulicatella balaenopterae]|uniref:Uncharacterized conserved protein YtfP, gamma-glutamylcyclotransferase (GGCT)/AIG2-like family n=1 Tax=Granulicatella balaenopterae TaxID=137733 RepID=A0A1H9GPV2_9LACT|nr:gamma-glutamylcyclotransferase family protein [Granulicatella balaenopterae]SEQ52135.1 Uncharacterized conserved protein YtfP, gamma-glutamylcyclotransferase (GGCT)/AIG2-like family [Granulicatella balaenopterae]